MWSGQPLIYKTMKAWYLVRWFFLKFANGKGLLLFEDIFWWVSFWVSSARSLTLKCMYQEWVLTMHKSGSSEPGLVFNRQKYLQFSYDLQKYRRTSKNIPRSFWIFQDLSRPFRIFQDFPGFSGNFQYLQRSSRIFQIFQDFPGSFRSSRVFMII